LRIKTGLGDFRESQKARYPNPVISSYNHSTYFAKKQGWVRRRRESEIVPTLLIAPLKIYYRCLKNAWNYCNCVKLRKKQNFSRINPFFPFFYQYFSPQSSEFDFFPPC